MTAAPPLRVVAHDDPWDVRLARTSSPLLRRFCDAGVLEAADVHVADRLVRLGVEADLLAGPAGPDDGHDPVRLAAALAVRALRHGSVCVEVALLHEQVAADSAATAAAAEGGPVVDVDALPWPEPEAWLRALEGCGLVVVGLGDPAPDEGDAGGALRPLRLVDGRLYLERYRRLEEVVAQQVDARAGAEDGRRAPGTEDTGQQRLGAALDRLLPAGGDPQQRRAAEVAASGRLLVLVGGPGTGKTTTTARLLAVLAGAAEDGGPSPRVALAAPTGKAAARLQEAVASELAALPEQDRDRLGRLEASTLHRLLGLRPGSTRARYGPHHRLPADVVVVDESSMVSLELMSRLLVAVRPDARLLLLGDPDQLASVEAGAVLGDLVERLGDRGPVVRLEQTYRFGGAIAGLASAVRDGRADDAVDLLRAGTADDGSGVAGELELVEVDLEQSGAAALRGLRADVVDGGTALVAAARAGDAQQALALLARHRVLCGHRRGPFGEQRWGEQVQRWLLEAVPDLLAGGTWWAGRPLLMTSNDPVVGLFNGDSGVVLGDAGGPGHGAVAVFGAPEAPRRVPVARLSDLRTVHAMTVHRSQGSQLDRVTLVLPPVGSPLLTRELLYTAVTRARRHVRVVGTEAAVRRAVTTRAVRASGLAER